MTHSNHAISTHHSCLCYHHCIILLVCIHKLDYFSMDHLDFSLKTTKQNHKIKIVYHNNNNNAWNNRIYISKTTLCLQQQLRICHKYLQKNLSIIHNRIHTFMVIIIIMDHQIIRTILCKVADRTTIIGIITV